MGKFTLDLLLYSDWGGGGVSTAFNIRIKVPIRFWGILYICNLWVLLRKIGICLVGRKFYLHGLFLLLKLTEVTSIQESVLL